MPVTDLFDGGPRLAGHEDEPLPHRRFARHGFEERLPVHDRHVEIGNDHIVKLALRQSAPRGQRRYSSQGIVMHFSGSLLMDPCENDRALA